MKRLLVRMSVLALILVLGGIVIAQAQRGTVPTASAPSEDSTPGNSPQNSSHTPPNRQFQAAHRLAATDLGEGRVVAARATEVSSAPLEVQPSTGTPSRVDPFARGTTPGSSVTRVTPEPAPSASGGAFPVIESRSGSQPGPSVGSALGLGSPASAPAVSSPSTDARPGTTPTFAGAIPSSQPAPSNLPTFGLPAQEKSRPMSSSASGGASQASPSAAPERVSTAPPVAGALDNAARAKDAAGSPPAVPAMPRSGFGTPPSGEPAPFRLDSTNPSGSLAPDAAGGRPPAGDAAASGLGNGRPGAKQLEGPQAPALTVEKSAPPEVQVGRVATFQTRIRNTGPIAAQGLEIRDEVPRGARLVETAPKAAHGVNGELIWRLGTLKSGEETVVEMQVMPNVEGEIGSVATVVFQAEATARSLVTKPELAVRTTGPGQVLIGEEAMLSITITNPGSGVASGVVLEAKIPPSMRHSAGTDLEYEVGTLKPQESRQLELKLASIQAGLSSLVLGARGEGNLKTESRFEMDVIAPRLDLAMEGPKRRFLEREATYVLSVSNPGTAPARQVQLVCQLPPGLKFVNANNAGQYEAETRTVHWLLEELPVNEVGKVELVTLPVEAGEHKLLIRTTADKGLAAEKEQPVLIEGIAAIQFTLVDQNDPVERGGETSYDVHVVNQGSKAANNVRMTLLLPPEMRALAAEGPTRHQIDGQRVVFEGLARLAPKAETTYRVRVQGLQPGDLRIRAQLLTDEIQTPVTKEESTRVFSDE